MSCSTTQSMHNHDPICFMAHTYPGPGQSVWSQSILECWNQNPVGFPFLSKVIMFSQISNSGKFCQSDRWNQLNRSIWQLNWNVCPIDILLQKYDTWMNRNVLISNYAPSSVSSERSYQAVDLIIAFYHDNTLAALLKLYAQ